MVRKEQAYSNKINLNVLGCLAGHLNKKENILSHCVGKGTENE